MCAQESHAHPIPAARIASALTWLGGGDWRELADSGERSGHAIGGVLVLLGAALAALVAALALTGSTHWPTPAILAGTLIFGSLVGAVTRAIAAGPKRGRRQIAARGVVGLVVGVIVGELAAVVLLSGSIDRRLDQQAARSADTAPAVVAASADLDRARSARAALDKAVEAARGNRDAALVVARCEYNPTPACPQTRITGVPGAGPETQTANASLADAQRELDDAVAVRDREAPGLDAIVDTREQALAQARQGAAGAADRGLGARWLAMNRVPLAPAVLLLQVVAIGFFALLSFLPLMLLLWRGETTQDRSAAARAQRDRAELDADTAIAVKRAQVRAAAETLWAEQQLARTRLAVEAQNEIDRVEYRRRVTKALHGSVHASSRRQPDSHDEDMYLPIAAEAEAASRRAAQLPAAADVRSDTPETLPARVEPADQDGGDTSPRVPSIPDVAKVAARWVRPFVPSIVARAIDTTSQPLRAARQVFEEVEQITFTLKRTHTVTVHSEQTETADQQPRSVATEPRADAHRPRHDGSIAAIHDAGVCPPGELTGHERYSELTEDAAPRQLPHGRRQLPPAE